jgi:hypothetical protein
MVVVLPAFANFQLGCKSMTAVLFRRFKSTYSDVDIDCSGRKQAQPANGAFAIMITGTISVLMRTWHIRWDGSGYVSGWNGIGQSWARKI